MLFCLEHNDLTAGSGMLTGLISFPISLKAKVRI